MKPSRTRGASAAVLLLALLCAPSSCLAHIGTLNAIYEGLAGPIPVRVIVRPPGVVPGLADIDVRVLTNGVKRVTVLPAHWRTGLEGAPPPDVCEPVPGEPNLYHAQLWLMARGAYSVHVAVETIQGSGKLIVPVNSLATQRLPMPRFLGRMLVALGVLLFLLAITVVGAAIRESVLEPGVEPTVLRRRLGYGAVAAAGLILVVSLHLGRNWWNSVDLDYRNNRMHKPARANAEVREENGQRFLRFSVLSSNNHSGAWAPLVPDHGKLMHLFLVREPAQDAFAHLHPARRDSRTFEAALPPLPAGRYRCYADVTHESGFAQTLTAHADVPEPSSAPSGTAPATPTDPDDSWHFDERTGSGPAIGKTAQLGDGFTMTWDDSGPLMAGRETTLRFRVTDAAGQAAALEPYVSMLAHAVIRRDDGAVFTHLHPAGSISIASQQVFQIRAGEKERGRITPEMLEKLCQPPGPELSRLPLSFPYEFPKPGRYRVWVQVKLAGRVRTAVFDAEVLPAS